MASLKQDSGGNGPSPSDECSPSCSPGFACLLDEWGGSDCFLPCLDDSDCPTGWTCPCFMGCPSQRSAGGHYIELISDYPYNACLRESPQQR